MSKAMLSFATLGENSQSFDVTVIRYSRGYQNQVVEATVRSEKHGYPMRVREQDIQLTIQCKSVSEYDNIKKAIRASQSRTLLFALRGYVRFMYPDLGIDLLGFIQHSPEGVRRFESAPVLSFSMSLFQDTIFTTTEEYSSADGTWKDIFGSDLAYLAPPTPLTPGGNPIPPGQGTNGGSGLPSGSREPDPISPGTAGGSGLPSGSREPG